MTEIKVSPVVPSEIEYDSAGEIGAAPRKNEPTRSARDSCPHPVVVYWQHLVPCSSSSACRLWWELEAHTFSSYPSNGKKVWKHILKKRGNSLFTPIHICLSLAQTSLDNAVPNSPFIQQNIYDRRLLFCRFWAKQAGYTDPQRLANSVWLTAKRKAQASQINCMNNTLNEYIQITHFKSYSAALIGIQTLSKYQSNHTKKCSVNNEQVSLVQ